MCVCARALCVCVCCVCLSDFSFDDLSRDWSWCWDNHISIALVIGDDWLSSAWSKNGLVSLSLSADLYVQR